MSVAWCSETNRPIAGDWAGSVHLWDKANPTAIHKLDCNPPSIETRIANITRQLQQARAAYEPLSNELAELDREIASIKAENESEVELRIGVESRLKAVKTKLFSADQMLESNLQQQEEWKKELSGKEKAIPQIGASLTNAKSALQSLGTDPELAEMVEKLESRHLNMTARASELNKLLQQVSSRQESTKAEIAEFEKARKNLEVELASLNTGISEREIELGNANDRRAALKSKLDTAQSEIDQPQQALLFWNAELAFAESLRDLEATLAAAEDAEQLKLDELDAANAKLAQAQALVDAAKARHHDSAKQIDSIELRISELKSSDK